MAVIGKNRVLIMIDQATRDAFSQLLVAHYLTSKGAQVYICNQGTLVAMYERYRPQVVLASWLVGGQLMEFLKGICGRTHLVLVDQEGGKLGEIPFKRSFTRQNGVKAQIAKECARVLTWGKGQAQWLRELGIMKEERIVVAGSPRLDPYLIREESSRTRAGKYLGVTLRSNAVTSQPMRIMEQVFHFSCADKMGGISVGYPVRSQHEDRVWHAIAGTRCMFEIMINLAGRSNASMVLRPDPWEQYSVYDFLTRQIPHVSVEPTMTQPEYVKNAFAILDESSSLSVEALLAGTPVISIRNLMPNLRERIGGEEGGLYNAPYAEAFWGPKSVEEAVEYVLKAEKGELALSPCMESIRSYLRDYHSWPRTRPSCFEMGDAILELLAGPVASDPLGYETSTCQSVSSLKRSIYRYVPGSVALSKAKLLGQCVFSTDRELWKKYHYLAWFYPHHEQVLNTFTSLIQKYGAASSQSVDNRVN